MQYEMVSKEELAALRAALPILERVLEGGSLELYFYGLTTDRGLLNNASLILEEDEEPVTLSQIAVCVPLTGDTIYYLTGSGLILRDETFAYISGSDGARINNLRTFAGAARLTLDAFTETAMSSTDAWIDDFLTEAVAKVTKVTSKDQGVARTEPATHQASSIDKYLNS